MTKTLQVRVSEKKTEAKDICSLALVPMGTESLPSFAPGSHIDVHLPGGIIRQYSLCNDSSELNRYVIAVLKDSASRGGSRLVHEAINTGDILTISTPKNHFALATGAQKSLLMAGGIGVTPILCMAKHLSAEGNSFELHYCARSEERAAFLEDLRHPSLKNQTQMHFDDGPKSQHLNISSLLSNPEGDVHLYVCGPKGFMDAVLGKARELGWSESLLHYEFFTSEPISHDSDEGFEVQIASTGQVITVNKDESVTFALMNQGIDIMTSCEQGVCGTCRTGILEGVPDHRDMFLTPEEQASNKEFMPCCSRSKSSRLVLDL